MVERNEPKATARHKQLAKSKEDEVEAKKNRLDHEKVALSKYRSERKEALKKVPKEDRPAEKAKTREEVAKRKELIANYRDDFLASKRALKDEKAAKKLAAIQSKVSDHKDGE
jgi:hypothetical protein